MFGVFQLLGRPVDLDVSWVSQVHFEVMSPDEDKPEPTWDSCFLWFAALFRFTLESGATVVWLRHEREADAESLFQAVFVPRDGNSQGGEWLELVPMHWSSRGMRAVRMIALMMPWSKRGKIRYRYKGKWAKARCIEESPDDLVVYCTADRPALRRLTPEHSSTD